MEFRNFYGHAHKLPLNKFTKKLQINDERRARSVRLAPVLETEPSVYFTQNSDLAYPKL